MDAPNEGSATLVTGLPSGRAEVRNAVTARLLASAVVRDQPSGVPPDLTRRWLFAAKDLLLVFGVDQETLTAYGLPRLDRLWSTRWADRAEWDLAHTCAGVLCLQSLTGRCRGVDRRTGRLLWDQPWEYLAPVGSMLWGARREAMAGEEWPLVLVDPATGRQRHELGTWRPAGQLLSGSEVVLTRRDPASGRSWVSVLEPGATAPRVVGAVPADARGCLAIPGRIICRRRDSSIEIWRYR